MSRTHYGRVGSVVLAWTAVCMCGAAIAAEDKQPEPGPAVELHTTEVKLPSSAEKQVAVGGGGRYLVLHFKELRKLGIFDIKTRKIIGYVSAADDKVTFAASQNHVVVHLGAAGTISRYRLDNQEREKSVPLAEEVAAMGMGSASEGPLVVVTSGYYAGFGRIFDLQKLQPRDMRLTGYRTSQATSGTFNIGRIINVSADGRLVGGTNEGVSPSGVYLALIDGDTVEVRHEHSSWGAIRPAPTGEIVYTSRGAHGTNLKPLSSPGGYAIPELTRGVFTLVMRDASDRGSKKGATLSLQVQGDSRPLATLDRKQLGIDSLPSHPVHFANAPWHQRLLFHAPEKTLVAIPDDRQRLILADLDVDKILDQSGRDYLFVSSQPPTSIKSGQAWKYKIEARAKKGPVKMKLESGPEGMKLSPQGDLQWKVPASAKTEAIIVSVKDGTDQEIFHTFTLTMEGTRESAPPRVAGEERRSRPSRTSRLPRSEDGEEKLRPSNAQVDADELEALLSTGKDAASTKEIVRGMSDAVVVVSAGDSVGTGFFVGSKGHLVTCYHVLQSGSPTNIIYRTPGTDGQSVVKTEAELIRADQRRDLALLKIKSKEPLPTVTLALGEEPESGEGTVVIGNPGVGRDVLSHSVTTGVVSSKERMISRLPYIQTSAAVNPGNSGGPMFNERGQVIGVVVLKADIENTAFAIPVSTIAKFLRVADKPRLKTGVVRTWKDANGKQVEASLAEFKAETVQLKKPDGKVVSVPLARLGQSDQDLLKHWADPASRLEIPATNPETADRIAKALRERSVPEGRRTARGGDEGLDGHPIKVEIIPEGNLRSLVPTPGVPRAPFQTLPQPGVQQSDMRAKLRVTNIGGKTINRLVLRCQSDIPGAGPQTQSVDALRGLGGLGPKMTTDVMVNFPPLPGAAQSRGVGTLRVSVAEIAYQ
ncbi:MAG: trypsin-like peptidase domain-containing protein [Planctomycetes bacterium]|nr:trypsin-like peptidase domain-containing protein [Planctomycetota bacterium]